MQFADFYKPFHTRPADLADMLPWRAIAAPGVVLLKKNGLLRCYRVRGIDVTGETPEAVGARMIAANDALKRLDGSWTVQTEAQRMRLMSYPERTSSYDVANRIEQERRHIILEDPGARETRYFLSVTWTPRAHGSIKLREFVRASDAFLTHLGTVLAETEALSTPETLTYLKSTVSDVWNLVAPPIDRTRIDLYLRDVSWHGGSYPEWDARLGNRHVRCLSLTGYPAMSTAVQMQRLDSLDVDYRWCTRWTSIDKHLQDSILVQRQEDYIDLEKTPLQHTAERFSRWFGHGKEQRVVNESATRTAEDISHVRQEIGADIYGVGRFSTTVVTWGKDTDEADENASQIKQALQGIGFVVRREGEHGQTVPVASRFLQWLSPPHHTAAWLGTHPGNDIDNVRKTVQTTMTLAHLMPGLRATWPGPERDDYMDEAPWFMAHTGRCGVVRVSMHVRDVGHHMYIGPSGSGKSTFMLHGVAQWFLYPNVQASIFDVGRTARLLTLLMGGQWIDLGRGSGVQLQPLRYIDERQEFGWALGWLASIAETSGVRVTGLVQEYLANRLADLRKLPASERTLTRFLHLCQEQTRKVEPRVSAGTRDINGLARPNENLANRVELQHNIQRALHPFVKGGEYGYLLDGDHDDLADGSHLYTFEQRDILSFKSLADPVIQYCFRFVERRMSTKHKMLLVMEEAALLSMKPLYRDQWDAWLMTKRKEGAAVALVVNSLKQAMDMGLGKLSAENCPTRFYFPNPRAMEPDTAAVLEQSGLTREEVRIIATSKPTEDVYYVSETGKRLLHMPFSRSVLDCLARNDDEDHELMDKLLEREGPEGFRAAWFRHHGYEEGEGICDELRVG